MGGVITVVPDGYRSDYTAGWVIGGGAASLNAAVADASDATYITDTTPGSGNTRIGLNFATSTLPAGSAIKYAYPVVRSSQAAGNRQLNTSIGTLNPPDGIVYQSPVKVWTPVAGIADTYGTAAGAIPQSRSQGVVDNLTVSVGQHPSSAFVEDHRVYRVDARVQYVDSPTVTASTIYPPSANTTTTKPGVQWSYNSADGMPQYEYRVALWKLTDINLHSGTRAGFEAAIADIFDNASFTGTDALQHAPVWRSSNEAGTSSWVVSTATNAATAVDLAGSGDYVYYVQVSALHAGERLAHPTSKGILDFTMALALPTQPSSITPTWQRDFQFRTQVLVGVPSQSLTGWTGRKIYVERRIVGGTMTDWQQLPLGVQEAGAGAGTLTFYDTLPAVNRTLEYRTKAVLWHSSGALSASTYRTSASVVADFVGFVLRDPLDDASSVVFRIRGDFKARQREIQGQFEPLAAELPVLVSDSIKGRVWSVEVRVKDAITEQYVKALRAKKSPLVLHTDMTDCWYWVRIGPDMDTTVLRQSDRRDATKREQIWQMELIETNAIPGQPQVYF